jgi:hypothetical protein
MKATAILERTEKFLKLTESKNFIDLWAELKALREEAAAEIRREEAKNGGKLNRTKAAERVIKSAKSYQAAHECFHGAWIDSAGRQCLCDSFQAYRLREALPLETLPEKISPIDLNRIISKNLGATLELPDVGTLRAFIKTEKARKKAAKDKSLIIYDFGEGLPAVNAEYLLNALEILPGCTATASRENSQLRAIYFESPDGDGILMPVRKGAIK